VPLANLPRLAVGAYLGRKRWGLLPISANLFRMFSSKLSQNRHPERSAPQIYRVTQRLMAPSRRTPAVLILPMMLGAFRPPKPENRICYGTRAARRKSGAVLGFSTPHRFMDRSVFSAER
jgi:hypothetical protein